MPRAAIRSGDLMAQDAMPLVMKVSRGRRRTLVP